MRNFYIGSGLLPLFGGVCTLWSRRSYVQWVIHAQSNIMFGHRSGKSLASSACQKGNHIDVLIWKHFPHYWPLWEVSTDPWQFPSQRASGSLAIFVDFSANKLLDGVECQRFETLWRSCDITVITEITAMGFNFYYLAKKVDSLATELTPNSRLAAVLFL